MNRRAVTVLIGLVIYLVAQPAWAVIVFLKGQDEPIRGYFVRENEHVIVIDELMPDNSVQERTISRSDIDDLIRTVSDERLASLSPDDPNKYREYAEELAEKSKDPDARVAAIRLFLIAAHLAPDRLGRSCLLGMVPLARTELEQRRFRAMAYLLDPTHDPSVLTMNLQAGAPKSDIDPRQAKFMLKAFRLLRQRKRREALSQAGYVKMKDRLPQLTDTITYSEFEQACSPTCPHCTRGDIICPRCDGNRFVRGSSCATCGASGELDCPYCDGEFRENPLPPSLLKRILQLEIDWLPEIEATPESARPPRPAWSQSVQQREAEPNPPLSLESLTEFDPRKNVYVDGRWKE